MKQLITCLLAAIAFTALASEGGPPLDKFPKERVTDVAALQNGAKLFVNYCLSCHAASSMRYNRMVELGLTEDQIKKNLLLATEKVGETMKTALDPKDAKPGFITALIYTSQNKFEDARREYQEVMRLAPDDPMVHFYLGAYYENINDNASAAKHFRDAIRLDSGYADAYNYLGYMFAEDGVRLDEALETLKEAIPLYLKDEEAVLL